jgi:hypothetical protein
LNGFAARFFAWTAVTIGTTAWITYSEIARSQANMVNDPSSMAWVGFLPFILPFFLLQAFVYVAPVAAITELWLLLCRYRRDRS